MRIEHAGVLSRHDPLHALLRCVAGDQGDFQVFRIGHDGAVYLYVADGARVIGKFYGRKCASDSAEREELRSTLLQREFDNLVLLRNGGFTDGRLRVPRPLAKAEAIDWVLLEEFADGRNLHDALRDNVAFGGDVLDRSLTNIAGALARLHRLPPADGILPRKNTARYFEKVLTQLRDAGVIADDDRRRLAVIGTRWNESGALGGFTPVMIHGDATPEHFLYDQDSGTTYLIDLESLRLGDPAEDIGYLAGEIKHLFWTYTRDRWASEWATGHLYRAYTEAMQFSGTEAEHLTERGRYFMGCAELRIARNSYLRWEHRLELRGEAEQCLRI
jgi:hypothetical protein